MKINANCCNYLLIAVENRYPAAIFQSINNLPNFLKDQVFTITLLGNGLCELEVEKKYLAKRPINTKICIISQLGKSHINSHIL